MRVPSVAVAFGSLCCERELRRRVPMSREGENPVSEAATAPPVAEFGASGGHASSQATRRPLRKTHVHSSPLWRL